MNNYVISRQWWHRDHPIWRRFPHPIYPTPHRWGGSPPVDKLPDGEVIGFQNDHPIVHPLNYTGTKGSD